MASKLKQRFDKLVRKGEEKGYGLILSNIERKLNPIEITAMNDNIEVRLFELKIKIMDSICKLKDMEENLFLKIMGRFNSGVNINLVNTLCKEDFDNFVQERNKLIGDELNGK